MAVHWGLHLLTRSRRLVAVVAAASVTASLLSGTPALAKPKGAEVAKPPATSPGQSVKGVKPLPTKFVTPSDDAKATFRPTRMVWPKAASARVELPSAGARGRRRCGCARPELLCGPSLWPTVQAWLDLGDSRSLSPTARWQ